jgi:hypothetical protein
MDHRHIEEHQIVSRYAMGKLEPADRVEFEEHMVDCQRCLDELELTDDFRHTLQHVAESGATGETAAPTTKGVPFRLSEFWPRAVLFAALLLVSFLFLWKSRRFESELDLAERRFATEHQAREAAEAQLRETLAQATAPLFTLNLTRGADLGAAEPPNVISIPPGAKSIALSLEWQNDPDFRTYRATLTDAAGRGIWAADRIVAPSSNALAITLPASLFQASRYVLTIEGTAAGRYSVVGRYSFRVVLSK